MSNAPEVSRRVPPSLAKRVIGAASTASRVDAETLLSVAAAAEYARIRWAIMLVLRRQGYSLPAVGEVVNRNHSTVKAGVKRAETLLEEDKDFEALVLACQDSLIEDKEKRERVIEARLREQRRRAEAERIAEHKQKWGYGAPRSAKAQALLKQYEARKARTRAFMERPGYAKTRGDSLVGGDE